MNSVAASLLSGAISAIGLNIIHETLRKTMPHPARVDIVGMRSVAKLARAAGTEPPEHLRSTALAGDIVSNALYYSLDRSIWPSKRPSDGSMHRYGGWRRPACAIPRTGCGQCRSKSHYGDTDRSRRNVLRCGNYRRERSTKHWQTISTSHPAASRTSGTLYSSWRRRAS